MKGLSLYLPVKGESNGSWLITEIEVSFGSIIMGIYSQIINGSEIPNHKFHGVGSSHLTFLVEGSHFFHFVGGNFRFISGRRA